MSYCREIQKIWLQEQHGDGMDVMVFVGPQVLPTLLKAIIVRKSAYPSLIVHSPKLPRHSNVRRVDGCGQPSDLPTVLSVPPHRIRPLITRLLEVLVSLVHFRMDTWCRILDLCCVSKKLDTNNN